MVTVNRIIGNLERAKRESWARMNALKISRANRCCEVCGTYYYDVKKLLGHHSVSLKNGGEDKADNIIIVCGSCVNVIHAFEDLEWAEDVFKIDILYMSKWRLMVYVLKSILLRLKGKIWQRQS